MQTGFRKVVLPSAPIQHIQLTRVAVLQAEMDALLKRLGHTHPPSDYVRMDTAIAALTSTKADLPDLPCFRLMECDMLCDTEVCLAAPFRAGRTVIPLQADTQRYYWMTASERCI